MEKEPLQNGLNVSAEEVKAQTKRFGRQLGQVFNRLNSVKVIKDCDQLIEICKKVGVSIKQIESTLTANQAMSND